MDIDTAQAKKLPRARWVDVREPQEREDEGFIAHSLSIPLSHLETASLDPSCPTIVYCASGVRSKNAVEVLRKRFPGEFYSLKGGFRQWKGAGEKYVGPPTRERYQRQTRLPGFGQAGQERLSQSKVLLVGLGGLGCPAAIYLVGAGVGKLGIIDGDTVSLSNLHRQVLFSQKDIGRKKVEAGAEKLRALNSEPEIETHPFFLEAPWAEGLIEGYDLVIDGSDQFQTRYLINRLCRKFLKPWVYASVFQYEGHFAVFDGRPESPCLQCLFPEDLLTAAPTCVEGGVIGTLPGILGQLQAWEAIKRLANLAPPPVGKLLRYSALSHQFQAFSFERDAACPLH